MVYRWKAGTEEGLLVGLGFAGLEKLGVLNVKNSLVRVLEVVVLSRCSAGATDRSTPAETA